MQRPRNDIRNELIAIKKELEAIKGTKDAETQTLVKDKEKGDITGNNLLTLLKLYMMEAKNTSNRIEQMQKSIENIEEFINADLSDEPTQGENLTEHEPTNTTVEVPISELDRKILQLLQTQNAGAMACADDIKKAMGYKGRNAASARLNKLRSQGLLERYQLGHKVYYKFNAGKTTKRMLIVSPPQ